MFYPRKGINARIFPLLRSIALLGAMFSYPTYAREAGPGLITDVQVDGNNNAQFAVSGPTTTKPSCVAWDRFVFNVTTGAGQAMLAYLLTAQATGKKIVVYGADTCSIYSNQETAFSLRDGW